ncbi:hypothetical protein CAEBREN_13498 [Caenorhabditis brenneri]|uniref:MULE transposase domain-containing protein n=1 Tax=Caenorhabditis brenneri TaxID=135651 RepID=G0NDS9_CAEBE|nr:hypothetical protein CAEBREN_13498 [Caenorhabditis brenneri]
MARQSLKKRCHDGTPREVIDSIRTEYGADASMCIGDYHTKRKIIDRAKASNKETKEMDAGGAISDFFSKSITGEKFLICQKTAPEKPMIIFSSETSIDLLSQSEVIFSDGTFECTPSGYTQMFTIHGYISDNVVRPLVFALIADKQLSTYETMIEELKKEPKLQNWSPKIVISDFESAIKTAFENSFVLCENHGCLFHLIKAWRSKSEKIHLYREFYGIILPHHRFYDSNHVIDGRYQEFWRLLKVLPYIASDKIPDYYDLIKNTLQSVTAEMQGLSRLILRENILFLTEFLTYIEINYVLGNGSSPPRFPPSLWTCSVVTESNIHRTTNVVESWHRNFSSVIHKHHKLTSIKLSDLCEKIRQEEHHTKLDHEELSRNSNFKVNKARTTQNIKKDAKLLKAVTNKPKPPAKPLEGIQLLLSFVYASR